MNAQPLPEFAIKERARTSSGASENYKKYHHQLDHSPLTNEQKTEFLKALWLAMAAFADLGHGTHQNKKS